MHNKEKFYYEDFTKEEYFDENKPLNKKIIYSEDKVENDEMRNALLKMSDKKEKKMKAYVWIADNFPIKSSVRKFFIYFS